MNRETLDDFLQLDADVRVMEDDLKDLKARRDDVEQQLRKEFEEDGIQNVKGTDGSTVFLTRTLRANAKDGDREAVAAALEELGLTEFLTTTFNTNTVSSYVREQDKLGNPLPQELANTLDIAEIFQLRVRRR